MSHSLSRRRFLQQSAGLAALTATVPIFLQKTARALGGDGPRAVPPIPGLKDNHVLVLVQMAGGNDGLNSVVPHADDAYYRARPSLAVERKDVLKINDEIGFPSVCPTLKGLFDDGHLALVQNVGYPNPDLSHFRSTEIWETASRSDQNLTSGWVGRYFDNECSGARSALLGLQFGQRPALTFAADRPRSVTLANPALLQWKDESLVEGMQRINEVEKTRVGALDFVQRAANDMLGVSKQIGQALKDDKSSVEYLPFQFSQTLRIVARMIEAEVPTRVYYVSLGGFDTHAGQKMRHLALLQEFSDGLSSFVRDLKARGQLDRTLIMSFSEFGRRVAENKSLGTDHGTAGPMFLAGGNVQPGLHGANPDLSKLTEGGDLIHKIDFRAVYAAVLQRWFGADPARIMEGVVPCPGLLG